MIELGEMYNDEATASKILTSLVGKRLIIKIRQSEEAVKQGELRLIGLKKSIDYEKRRLANEIEIKLRHLFKTECAKLIEVMKT